MRAAPQLSGTMAPGRVDDDVAIRCLAPAPKPALRAKAAGCCATRCRLRRPDGDASAPGSDTRLVAVPADVA